MFLIDSGAGVSILPEELYRQIPEADRPPLVKTDLDIRAGNMTQIDIIGRIHLLVRIQHLDYQCIFHVSRDAVQPILGMDFMQRYRAFLDTGRRKLVFNNRQIKAYDSNGMEIKHRVEMLQTTMIPPNRRFVVQGKIRGRGVLKDDDALVVEGARTLFAKKGMVVARVLVKPRNHEVPIEIQNFTDEWQSLEKGTTLGVVVHAVESRQWEPEIAVPVVPVKRRGPITINHMFVAEKEPVLKETAAPEPDPCVWTCGEATYRYETPPDVITADDIPEHVRGIYQKNAPSMETVWEALAFKDLLKTYSEVFAKNKYDMGKTNVVQHHIETGDEPPFKQTPRRLPMQHHQEIQTQVRKLAETGVIRPSRSPYASNVLLVKKKDGSWRMCVDYRQLNNQTKNQDRYHIPRMDDTLDALGGAKFFCTLDLIQGYHQVELSESSKPKTAFVTPHMSPSQWEYNCMPFGIQGGPATFQRLMDTLLHGLEYKIALAYLDDVIVFGATRSECMDRLAKVFHRLQQAQLKLKPSKCTFFEKETVYLGHVVSAEGIKCDPEKVRAVRDWKRPRTCRQAHQFVAFVNYYHRFIKDFAAKSRPLYALTRKKAKFKWGVEEEEAFQELKRCVTEAPVMAYPRSTGQWILDTDASGHHIGAVLSQMQPTDDGDEEVERPIAYASRTLNQAEQRYCTRRRELLSCAHHVKHFRPYLYGQHVIIRTDHASLKYVKTMKHPDDQAARWIETLSETDYTIVIRPGKDHCNADALSRLHVVSCPGKRCICPGVSNLEATGDTKDDSSVLPSQPEPDEEPQYSDDEDDERFAAALLERKISRLRREFEDAKFERNYPRLELAQPADVGGATAVERHEEAQRPETTTPTTGEMTPDEASDGRHAKEAEEVNATQAPIEMAEHGGEQAGVIPPAPADATAEPQSAAATPAVAVAPVVVTAPTIGPISICAFAFAQKWSVDDIAIAQQDDPDMRDLYLAKESGRGKPGTRTVDALSEAGKQYMHEWNRISLHENGILYRLWESDDGDMVRYQIILPSPMRNEVFYHMHHAKTAGHMGRRRTLYKLRRKYYWHRMSEDIRAWIDACKVCARRKRPGVTPKAPLKEAVSGQKNQRVAIDVLEHLPATKSGNRVILVMTDHFTKYLVAVALPNQQKETIMDAIIKEWVCRIGIPRTIHTDQGPAFESGLIREMCKTFGIQKTHTTPYRPQGDGQTERANQTILNILQAFALEDPSRWDHYLPFATAAYNATRHDSTGQEPNVMVYGHRLQMPEDLMMPEDPRVHEQPVEKHVQELVDRMRRSHELARVHLKKAASTQKKYYDRTTHLNKYEIGDAVWLKKHRRTPEAGKLTPRYMGPYYIVDVIDPRTFRVSQGPRDRLQVRHHDHLKPYHAEAGEPQPDLSWISEKSVTLRWLKLHVKGTQTEPVEGTPSNGESLARPESHDQSTQDNLDLDEWYAALNAEEREEQPPLFDDVADEPPDHEDVFVDAAESLEEGDTEAAPVPTSPVHTKPVVTVQAPTACEQIRPLRRPRKKTTHPGQPKLADIDEDAELQLPIETQTHDEQTTKQETATDLSTTVVEPQPRSAYYNLRRRVHNSSPELPSRTRFTKRHRVQINSIGIQAFA